MLLQLIFSYWSLICAIFLAVIFYWRWSCSNLVHHINALPGPKAWPIIGNLMDFINLDSEGLFDMLFNLTRKYGAISRLWLVNKPIVVIAAPELMQPILSSSKLITKSNQYDLYKPLFGDGLLNSTGEKWKDRRSIVTPAFHFKLLEGFYLDVFNKRSLSSVNHIKNSISANTNEIDMNALIWEFTVDTAYETLFGEHLSKSATEKVEFSQNIHWYEGSFGKRVCNPIYYLDSIFWLTPLGRKTKTCINSIWNFTTEVITRRRDYLKNRINNNGPMDFNGNTVSKNKQILLDLLINAIESGAANLTDQELQGEVHLLMEAGSTTTASALNWFLYLIARHPEEQNRIVRELGEVFGADKYRPCAYQDFAKMKYLECCIKETLRLYPSSGTTMRYLTEDVVVGDYTLPAGTTVAMSIYGMHRNPKVFPEPESFKPERFLPEQSEGRHPNAFIPFSAGPRNCIGSKFAMIHMKTLLSFLLRNFHFSSLEDSSQPLMKPRSSLIILRPKNKLNLIVKQRL